MFGLPLDEKLDDIKSSEQNILFIVGAEKVPPWVFDSADYNVAVGNQPHSEVAALALFIDAWFGESASERKFDGARLVIEGTNNGKVVHEINED